ncbi:MAG: hypothetical protein N2315_07485 [Thermanaerothrix sp.]|nr:hypothetical protein [Thermanaerothrix sp.]
MSQVRIDSVGAGALPKWMRLAAAVVGLFLLGDAMRSFFFGAGGQVSAKFIIGAACLYASGADKRFYASEEGVVKETRTWMGSRREVLPWEEVKFVTLAFKGDKMLAFFERDASGWKVLFKRSDREALKELLARRAPGVEVDLVGDGASGA